ncbi:MAG TPA: hypothetical protein VE673_13565 [Pseudonocardiaceae bacterium]|nr:hypothetical protein [Pseudonocardiaceae bacterium]
MERSEGVAVKADQAAHPEAREGPVARAPEGIPAQVAKPRTDPAVTVAKAAPTPAERTTGYPETTAMRC